MNTTQLHALRAKRDEQAARWEQARQNGDYWYQTTVHAANLDDAKEVASELDELFEQLYDAYDSRRFLGRILAVKRLRAEIGPKVGQLLGLARWDVHGNTELADIEVESGLLEPYSSNESVNTMVAQLMRDNVVVIGSANNEIQ